MAARRLSLSDRQRLREEIKKLPMWSHHGRQGMRTVLEDSGLPGSWIEVLPLSETPTVSASLVLRELERLGRLEDRPTHSFLGALVEYLFNNCPDLEGKLFLGLLLGTYELIEESQLATLGVPRMQIGSPQPEDLATAPHGPAFDLAAATTDGLEGIQSHRARFLDVEFLARGVRRAQSVCLLETEDGESVGTGFLLTARHVMTNHHVLPQGDTASRLRARFGFRVNAEGLVSRGVTCPVERVERYSLSTQLDYAILEISPSAGFVAEPLVPVAMNLEIASAVYLLQHPKGEPQKIVLQDNWVTYFARDHRRCQYLANTRYGSSGSPVFDEEWNLVAIHHSSLPVPARPEVVSVSGNEGIPMMAILPEIQDLLV